MINFKFMEAHAALELVNTRFREALVKSLETRKTVLVQWIDDTEKAEAKSILAYCFASFGELGSDGIRNRQFRFHEALGRPLAWEDYASEWRFLSEVIYDEMKQHHFFHYHPRFSVLLTEFEPRWTLILQGFPSTRDDAFAAIDCIALGHGTASVFHLMRVLERGIEAIAAEVNVACGYDTWHVILQNIDAAIGKIDKNARKDERHKRLPFLSKAAAEFRFFKDAWRNHVSHGRSAYDPDQALGVSTHVHEFMKVLCENGLTESSAAPVS